MAPESPPRERRRSLRPTPRLAGVAVATAPLAVAAIAWPPALWLWLAAWLLVAGWVVREALAVKRLGEVTVERELPTSWALGVETTVRLRLSGVAAHCRVQDFVPDGFAVEGLPLTVSIRADATTVARYSARPLERGTRTFGRVELLLRSPRGLLEQRRWAGAESVVRVVPNFRAVSKYALLATEDRLGAMGIRFTRRRGEGLEFRELRQYREGDSLRQVDWAATARIGQLISRQYQEERNQQVLFLLDCGRRMHARDGELTHFDHVLNALLLLTYVALRQGDAVGLLAFAGRDRWLPPQKGPGAMQRVLDRVFDLDTSHAPPDYLEASRRLTTLQRRRALVVLVSNLRDEDSAELAPAIQLLSRRHLVLIANLRERVLDDVLGGEITDLRSALTVGAVHHYMEARRDAWRKIQSRGALAIDVPPERLPEHMVNRYLEVKRAGLL